MPARAENDPSQANRQRYQFHRVVKKTLDKIYSFLIVFVIFQMAYKYLNFLKALFIAQSIRLCAFNGIASVQRGAKFLTRSSGSVRPENAFGLKFAAGERPLPAS